MLKIDHGKVDEARLKNVGEEVVLDMPMEQIPAEKLPEITIITITRNRRQFAPLMIDNWKRVYYPDKKIFWLIVDDSDDPKQGPILEIKALKDARISYYYMKPGESGANTVGYKRNFAMGLVKTDIVVMMDDDDFMYTESVLARACCLLFYGKQCVYSAEIGVYNLKQENSYILEGFCDIPEGTLMFTKKFWEGQKFKEVGTGEGVQMAYGQELHMIKLHYMFNIIVLNHGNNATGNSRGMRFKMTGKMKEKAAINAPINFYKMFPESFQKLVKGVITA